MQLTVRVILITLQLQGRGRRRKLAAGAVAGAARASTTGELIRKTRLYTTGAEKRQTHYAIRFITWGRCFPETWKSLRTSSRDSARAPARGGQTTTSDRKASARLQIRVPRKGTLICRRGTRSQNGLRQASKILLGSRSGSGPYG